MEFIKTIQPNPPIKIKFTEKLCRGIYSTNKDTHVAFNCLSFGIDLTEFENQPSFIDVHHFDNFIVYTSLLDAQYSQYVFSNKADKKFMKQIVETMPSGAAELLCEVADL